MKKHLQLLLESLDSSTVAFYRGRIIDRSTFLSHVEQVRKFLPDKKFCINLCEDRYHFLVLFAASISVGHISLLPNSRAEKDIESLCQDYKNNYLANDQDVEEVCNNNFDNQSYNNKNYVIEKDNVVAIVFTSGSTGTPKANEKTWGQLYESANRVKQRFRFNKNKQHSLIATVPPQHMFGFETTIIYPLILGVAIHASRPFYPLDIQRALSEMPSPHILITTPVHLKACTSEDTVWPEINFVISATDKMPADVASKAEKVLNTQVLEIYGCSEAGAIATRQMTKNIKWQLLNDYKLRVKNEIAILNVPGCKENIKLPDHLELYEGGYFSLLARNNDLVNIGGKRGSLKNLNHKLKSINGVSDAVFILPDGEQGKRIRLAAFVITSAYDEKTLRQELSKYIDTVFLPRPLIIVQKLPYNELGKLPRARLLELLSKYSDKNSYQEIA